uniref:Uncharacterized protein n=1 Tax=Arundo donax TaxID=35708 RepID=A0A0A9Q1T0_ARUDO
MRGLLHLARDRFHSLRFSTRTVPGTPVFSTQGSSNFNVRGVTGRKCSIVYV